jgi:16S rRNA (adenine1518-N6/adenine1519-N6)-dimethyltransferase
VRAAFGQRRKTMTNALAGLLANDRKKAAALLQQQGIDPRRRGETLDADEFVRLCRALRNEKGANR